MQQAANKLMAWANESLCDNQQRKTSTTPFTLSTKQKAGPIKLGDTTLKNEEEVTYLGVSFDKKQTWLPHIQKAEAKARKKLAILPKLSGTSWGANHQILKHVC